ncbi:MAG: DUF3293 domain-containing protein [Aestuariibacter sp.]
MKKIKKSQVSQLWEQYQQVKFRWPNKPMEQSSYAILTAYNPRSQVQDQIINRIKQQKLTTYLMANKLGFTHILCGDEGFSYCEPSIAAHVDINKATNLASIYRQNAFYWVTDGELWLYPALLNEVSAEHMGAFDDFLTTD